MALISIIFVLNSNQHILVSNNIRAFLVTLIYIVGTEILRSTSALAKAEPHWPPEPEVVSKVNGDSVYKLKNET